MPRTSHRPAALAVACTLLALLAVAGPAAACTCDPLLPPDEAFAAADGVFEARVDFVRVQQFEIIADLIVERSWKGVRTARVSVRTASETAACGFPFVIGETYLIYAVNLASVGEPLSWRTTLCNRTRDIADAAEDLAFLSGRTIVDTDEQTWSTVKALFD